MLSPSVDHLVAPVPAFGRALGPLLVAVDHEQGRGWQQPRVALRADLGVGAAAGAVQYGLSVFEGLKAYRASDGAVRLFRPRAHAERLRASAARLCLPDLGEELFLLLVATAAGLQEDLVPAHRQGALYLRPTLMASEQALGLRAAERHLLVVLASPCSDPTPTPLRLWAEDELVRAVPGGLGAVKTGANYAASLFGGERARRRGYDDALWLDGRWHRDLGETGTMNVFAVIGDLVVTPALDGTILPGVTRDSCLQLLRAWGIAVQERAIPFDELVGAAGRGTLRELFAVGTATRVRPIEEVGHRGGLIRPTGGLLAARLRQALADLQDGVAGDPFGWCQPIAGHRSPA
jgi:branched-chain amino acid aminotransferase